MMCIRNEPCVNLSHTAGSRVLGIGGLHVANKKQLKTHEISIKKDAFYEVIKSPL